MGEPDDAKLVAERAADAPKSYGEVFERYFAEVEKVLWHSGVRQDLKGGDVEDAASTVLLKFIEHGVLDQYDPNIASFPALFIKFVKAYVPWFRTYQQRSANRVPVYGDKPVGPTGAVWFEVYGPSSDGGLGEVVERVDLSARVREAHHYLERRGSTGAAKLFLTVAIAALDGRQLTTRDLREAMGWSAKRLTDTLRSMRELLIQGGFGPEVAWV